MGLSEDFEAMKARLQKLEAEVFGKKEAPAPAQPAPAETTSGTTG